MRRCFLRPHPPSLGLCLLLAPGPRSASRFAQFFQTTADPFPDQYQGVGDFLGEGPGQCLVPVRAERSGQDEGAEALAE